MIKIMIKVILIVMIVVILIVIKMTMCLTSAGELPAPRSSLWCNPSRSYQAWSEIDDYNDGKWFHDEHDYDDKDDNDEDDDDEDDKDDEYTFAPSVQLWSTPSHKVSLLQTHCQPDHDKCISSSWPIMY